MTVPLNSKSAHWATLFRIPNLFTVPGDALVGFALVMPDHTGGLPELVIATVGGLFLYMAGVVMNDLVDVDIDKTERPNRPLASGKISTKAARNVVALLITVALTMLAAGSLELLLVGIVLTGLIFIYNIRARRTRLTGSLVLGLCRSGSVALGIAAASPSGGISVLVIVALIVWFVYIASVSWLAYRETEEGPYDWMRWAPMMIMIVGGCAVILLAPPHDDHAVFRSVMGFIFAAFLTLQSGIRLGTPLKVRMASGRIRQLHGAGVYPPAIGMLISALIPMQAAILILQAEQGWVMLCALLILLAWPVNRMLARQFAAS